MTESITIRGVPYAFEVTGHGPLVLFGHGLFFDREMFRAQADALSADHRCVRLDWPGHGESGWRDADWGVEDLVADTLALLDVFGEPTATLVGLSQGAAVFTRVALAAPKRVLALVIMNATPHRPSDAVRHGMLKSASELVSGDLERVNTVFRQTAERMFCAITRQDHPEIVDRAIESYRRHNLAGLARAVKLGLSYESIAARLIDLTMPVGVIWGADDPLATLDLADLYARSIPNAQFQLIARAGHSAPLEQPAVVTKALTDFLHGLDAMRFR
jgi:3-oxoadipate enol-lactonase